MEKIKSFKLWKQDPSKGEVFTSIVVVNEMLDEIPLYVWKNPTSTFCDLSMGKGTFLIEIVNRLVNIYGYNEEDAKSRVFGYDIRVKYVNFLKRRGYKNVFHRDSLEEKFNMKFDIVVGNSPFQQNDGGGNGSSAVPIYNKFVEKSLEIAEKVLLITPSRWFKGGKGLDKFRENMLNRTDIKFIKHFENEKQFFDIELPGGFSYFFIDKSYNGLTKFINSDTNTETLIKLNNYDILIENVNDVNIIKKILDKKMESFSNCVLSRNPFGITSNFKNWNTNGINTITKDGLKYVDIKDVKDNYNIVNKYKLLISKADGAAFNSKRVISKYTIANPGTISTETYLVCYTSDTKEECENAGNYLMTKFSKFMLLLRMSSQNNSKDKFKWVPILDFTKNWSDEELFKFFNLNENEIKHIENVIK